MSSIRKIKNAIAFFSLLIATPSLYAIETALVSGFARSFLTSMPIGEGTITIKENGQKITTDDNGVFGPFLYPVGEPITLTFEKFGYITTQSGTVIVPASGLTDPHNMITFQVPSYPVYYLLAQTIGANIDDESCHVVTTITAYHKTLDDIPQGEAGATVFLSPFVNTIPFYFDVYKEGPFKGKTNPFTKGLTETSEDGGVAFINLPPRKEPYILSAIKSNVVFSEAKFLCEKGAFINVSPPQGPSVLY